MCFRKKNKATVNKCRITKISDEENVIQYLPTNTKSIEINLNIPHFEEHLQEIPKNLSHHKNLHIYHNSTQILVNSDFFQYGILILHKDNHNKIDYLPNNIEFIHILGIDRYNFELDSLPNKLMNLRLVGKINKLLDYLPFNLNKLEIIGDINVEINNLPMDLQELRIQNRYDKNLDNLPNGLKKLCLMHRDYNSIDYLPKGLIELFLVSYNGNLNSLPIGLKKLKLNYCGGSFDNLPEGLERLELVCNHNNKSCVFPPNLKCLSLKDYNYDLVNLPNSLEELNLSYSFPNNNKIIFPESLKKLRLHDKYHNDDIVIPDYIEILGIDDDNNSINIFPRNLKELHIYSWRIKKSSHNFKISENTIVKYFNNLINW